MSRAWVLVAPGGPDPQPADAKSEVGFRAAILLSGYKNSTATAPSVALPHVVDGRVGDPGAIRRTEVETPVAGVVRPDESWRGPVGGRDNRVINVPVAVAIESGRRAGRSSRLASPRTSPARNSWVRPGIGGEVQSWTSPSVGRRSRTRCRRPRDRARRSHPARGRRPRWRPPGARGRGGVHRARGRRSRRVANPGSDRRPACVRDRRRGGVRGRASPVGPSVRTNPPRSPTGTCRTFVDRDAPGATRRPAVRAPTGSPVRAVLARAALPGPRSPRGRGRRRRRSGRWSGGPSRGTTGRARP